jgi:hypothetical protein
LFFLPADFGAKTRPADPRLDSGFGLSGPEARFGIRAFRSRGAIRDPGFPAPGHDSEVEFPVLGANPEAEFSTP